MENFKKKKKVNSFITSTFSPDLYLVFFLGNPVELCSLGVRPFILFSVYLVLTLAGIADPCPLSHGPLPEITC